MFHGNHKTPIISLSGITAGAALTAAILSGIFIPIHADDSTASTAAGGIQLRREAGISMDKERLTITPDKVSVEFWFRNVTDKSITTEVAFPVPPYEFAFDDPGGPRDFADFKLWVDGFPTPYQIDAHAKLKEKDYTNLLRKLGIDIATFGKFNWKNDPPNGSPQIAKLSTSDRTSLLQLGLLDNADNGFPQWSVVKMYYWRQTFPVAGTVHIRHLYRPVRGFQAFAPDEIRKRLPGTCLSQGLFQELRAEAVAEERQTPSSGEYIYSAWVNYVLTTANTWKTPIKDFQLVVDGSTASKDMSYPYVSFCWDGPIEKVSPSHWVARRKDFIPQHELAVYYFDVPIYQAPSKLSRER